MFKTYLFLLIAVAFETFGSACLQASNQFTRLWPSLGVLAGFGAAFWFFSLVLREMPLGVTCALWSGIGMVLIAGAGFLFFGQKLDLAAILGIGLIIAGILVINLFSTAGTH